MALRILRVLQNYGLPLAVLLFGVTLQLARPWPVEFFQNLVFDQYNRWQPRLEANSPVLYVDIDEASLEEIGQFPWPRSVFASMVENLTNAGTAAIAFDILFAEPDRTAPSEILPVWQALLKNQLADQAWRDLQTNVTQQISNPDAALAGSVARSPVVVATMMNDDVRTRPAPKAGVAVRAQGASAEQQTTDPLEVLPASEYAIANRQEIYQAAMGMGAINARIDRDGIIRRASLLFRSGDYIYPSLSLESLRVAQRAGSIIVRASDVRGEGSYSSGFGLSRLKVGQVVAPIEPDGSLRIYYARSADLVRLSARDIINNQFDPDAVAGRIVFVGTSAAGLKDIRATPLDPATPGVEVHVQTVQQLLSGVFLKRPIWVQISEAGATLLAGLLLIFIVHNTSLLIALAAGLTAFVIGGAVSWHAFTEQLILVDPVAPTLTAFATFLVAAGFQFLQTARERSQVRNAFRYYLAPDMVEQLAANPDRLKLGGEIRDLTILFTDIRGFTTISEAFADKPDQLTHVINIFLTQMSQIIQSRHGTIDKYIGDNIMAFWNAPTEVAHHAHEACQTALMMIDGLEAVNQTLRDDPSLGTWDGEIKVGVGLNTGDTLVGNIGSDQRFNYSVIGDTVNIASRLEGQTKDYGVPILIGEMTRNEAVASGEALDHKLAFVELDLIALKGKETPERIFALLGDKEHAQDPAFDALVAAQEAFLAAYRGQEWAIALDRLGQIQAQYPQMEQYCIIMTQRIAAYQTTPPAADWDGSYVATSK